MKNKIVIILLIIVAILILTGIFGFAIYKNNTINFEADSDFSGVIIGEKIVNPDRIVYRDSYGNYYEFLKDTEKYNNLKALLGNSMKEWIENGEFITDEQIDEIHGKSFIEFDYETASKNYIINLENNKNQAVIKLANTGGNVVLEKINNMRKIKKTINKLIEGEKTYKLEYKELLSRNVMDMLEYRYQQQFKMINHSIYQVKIDNIEDYEKFKNICNLALDEKITEDTFIDNEIILTVSGVPKISVKVNLGNIKYTYERIENALQQYNAHLLIVSKIVNTDCIYNTDLSEIESKIDYDNMKVEHDDSVDNLEDIFVTDIDKYMNEYENYTSSITEEEATKIAEKGFEEAERICGSYDETTQTVEERKVKPNNFFSRKVNEYDKVYSENIEAYVFKRVDDMDLNGVEIFIDKKTGKIVGGKAFGD